jgi:carboxyl-terminal processing protease
MYQRHLVALFAAAILLLSLPTCSRAVPGAAATLDIPKDAQSAAKAVSPDALYHHVWEIISERFYEPTYNGQTWTRWEHRYDKKLHTLEDARKAIETMLASLNDRYTRYLDPTAFEGEKEMIASKLYGIGIQMGLNKTQKLVVIAPIDGTPAARAGLMTDDEIAEINGKPTTGLSVEQASKMIRGAIGTPVKLLVYRAGKRVDYEIIRDEIPIRSVHAVKMLDDKVGYIQLGTFMSERASEEVREALQKLSPARGLIIDLRSNPGGLVTNAIDICSMFLESGMDYGHPIIVSTVDRDGRTVPQRVSGPSISHQPLVVLINSGSASASEITSGALHDSKRAELVGQKSFGKGLVQSIIRLEDGSGVNVTIARYVTPNNTDIHKKGIVPDYAVDLQTEDYQKGRGPWFNYPENRLGPPVMADLKDLQLKKAVEVLETKMDLAANGGDIVDSHMLKLTPFTLFPNDPNPFGIGKVRQ